MKNLKKNISFLLMSLCLVGFISPERPKADLKQDQRATLVFYQKSNVSQGSFKLIVNGQVITKRVKSRSWFTISVPAGQLTIATEPNNRYGSFSGKEFLLEAQAGKSYYMESLTDYEFLVRTLYVVQRDSLEAAKYLEKYKQDPDALSQLE